MKPQSESLFSKASSYDTSNCIAKLFLRWVCKDFPKLVYDLNVSPSFSFVYPLFCRGVKQNGLELADLERCSASDEADIVSRLIAKYCPHFKEFHFNLESFSETGRLSWSARRSPTLQGLSSGLTFLVEWYPPLPSSLANAYSSQPSRWFSGSWFFTSKRIRYTSASAGRWHGFTWPS